MHGQMLNPPSGFDRNNKFRSVSGSVRAAQSLQAWSHLICPLAGDTTALSLRTAVSHRKLRGSAFGPRVGSARIRERRSVWKTIASCSQLSGRWSFASRGQVGTILAAMITPSFSRDRLRGEAGRVRGMRPRLN